MNAPFDSQRDDLPEDRQHPSSDPLVLFPSESGDDNVPETTVEPPILDTFLRESDRQEHGNDGASPTFVWERESILPADTIVSPSTGARVGFRVKASWISEVLISILIFGAAISVIRLLRPPAIATAPGAPIGLSAVKMVDPRAPITLEARSIPSGIRTMPRVIASRRLPKDIRILSDIRPLTAPRAPVPRTSANNATGPPRATAGVEENVLNVPQSLRPPVGAVSSTVGVRPPPPAIGDAGQSAPDIPAASAVEAVLIPPSGEQEALQSSVSPIIRPSETPAIQAVLGQYRSAFSTLDAGAASVVWPKSNARALDKAFRQLDRQEVEFRTCQIELAGAQATAQCHGLARYVPKVGNRDVRAEQRRWQFDLRKIDDKWIIDTVDVRIDR